MRAVLPELFHAACKRLRPDLLSVLRLSLDCMQERHAAEPLLPAAARSIRFPAPLKPRRCIHSHEALQAARRAKPDITLGAGTCQITCRCSLEPADGVQRLQRLTLFSLCVLNASTAGAG